MIDDGSQSSSGEGLPSMGHSEDPAWICAQGPFPEAHDDRVGLSRSYNFERFGEVVLWAIEEGKAGGQSLVLVDSKIRALEEEALKANQSNANCSMYETIPSENSPSPIFSVFGRPLLSGGSSSLGDFHGNDATSDMELLRVVSADGREWGEMTTGALLEVGHEVVSFGR